MNEVIDVRWRISLPCRIPIQHEYQLLGALSRLIPRIHQDDGVGVHSIRGIAAEPGMLELTRTSALAIRCHARLLPLLLPLSGKRLSLERFDIRLGVPQLYALHPFDQLASSFVTIKGFMEPEPFTEAVRRQLRQLSVGDSVDVDVGKRNVRRIKGNVIVGFQVTLANLSDQDSLMIQIAGIGGRRRLGAGIFIPAVSRTPPFRPRQRHEESLTNQA